VSRLRSFAATLALIAFSPASPVAADDMVKSGTVSLDIYRVAFIGSAGGGKGVLHYKGKSRAFTVTGLGIGGVGLSHTKASGTVYNLKKLEDFIGAYGSVRSGITVTDKSRDKALWVGNDKGVRLKLDVESAGVSLNLGADGLVFAWK
jgi:hypothetical protein